MRTPRRAPRWTCPEASSSFFGGGFGRGLGFLVGIWFVYGTGFVLPWGLGFVLGWGASFGTRLGAWGGGAQELLAVSGSRGQVVNVAPALHLCL